MNNYRKLNNIFGLIAFLVSLVVYTMTMESTASFWDCGEFISASFKLQVVHPPGAPLFLLLGRFFSLFAGSDLQMVPVMVNFFSALSSALCVMFTFWITTYFGSRLLKKAYSVNELNGAQTLAVMLSGLAGALALTFSDTFWFSAVEAEVYAASSFFTAITFWAILKWEERADQPHADRWLVLIGYLIGLAIGVHLLNLLVIPAIAFVYYFRRYKTTRNGIIITTMVAGVALLLVQLIIIPGIPGMAAFFDRKAVNSMGFGFGTGMLFFLVLLVVILFLMVRYSIKKNNPILNTAFLSVVFVIIGFSSYAMVVIRSNADTPINMNSPKDAYSLVYYLNREQYGDRPLLKGPFYDAKLIDIEEKSERWGMGKDANGNPIYKKLRPSVNYIWEKSRQTVFPRIYDQDQRHIMGYQQWADIPQGAKPNFSHNIKFFVRYQLGWMYLRYFMWNFSGRQNEDQGYIGPIDGNWISGIPFIDEMMIGPQAKIPDFMENNKGRNKYYMIPFILGILGLYFHIKHHKKDSFVLGVLFLITGVVLIMYLNPPPEEPRERDYVFVGSFQVFCTWLGLGALFIFDLLRRKMAENSAAITAGVITLVAPVLMASENWDDHNRHGRYMTIDFAKNYLASCPPNAILFTNGDNDTYPLWYAQNVEGIRTDVRVINLSLLSAGDYAETMQNKVYNSAPIKSSFTKDQVADESTDNVPYRPQPGLDQNKYYPLKEVMDMVAKQQGEKGFPVNKFHLDIDKEKAVKAGWVRPEDTALVVSGIDFGLPNNRAYKNTLMVLDAIANNMYDRPICFTSTTSSETFIGLQAYFELRGLVYRFVPIKTEGQNITRTYGRVISDTLYRLLVKEYKWGGIDQPGYFVDTKAKLVPNSVRQHFYRLAEQFLIEGNKAKAIEVLDHSLKMIPLENVHQFNLILYIPLYYEAGAKDKGGKLAERMFNDAKAMYLYYQDFRGDKVNSIKNDRNDAKAVMEQCAEYAKKYGDEALAKKLAADPAMGK